MQSTRVSFSEQLPACYKLTKLPDVHDVVLVLQNGSLVVVHIEIIGRTEDGHDARETSRPSLPVHAVSSVLGFVGTNDREQVVLLKEGACGGIREKV